MNTESKLENGGVTLPFVMSHQPGFVVKKAHDELNETAENKTRCLQELKEIIKDSNKISGIDFFDDFLQQYLRHKKYDVLNSFQQLQNFVSMRKKHPRYFQKLPIDMFVKMTSSLYASILPQRCPDGCVIIVVNLGKWKPGMSIHEVWNHLAMLFTQSLRDPVTQVCGYKMIYVFKNVSPKVLWEFTPQQAYFLYSVSMHCYPARFKQIHLVDESFLMKPLWLMVKGFLSEKIRKRIFIHPSPKTLLDSFPRSVLPQELGGDLKNYCMSDWCEKANEQLGQSTQRGQNNYF